LLDGAGEYVLPDEASFDVGAVDVLEDDVVGAEVAWSLAASFETGILAFEFVRAVPLLPLVPDEFRSTLPPEVLVVVPRSEFVAPVVRSQLALLSLAALLFAPLLLIPVVPPLEGDPETPALPDAPFQDVGGQGDEVLALFLLVPLARVCAIATGANITPSATTTVARCVGDDGVDLLLICTSSAACPYTTPPRALGRVGASRREPADSARECATHDGHRRGMSAMGALRVPP
jgi:hypothetical protein